MEATNNQPASIWAGFSDLELCAAIGYRTEELLLEPLVRAIIICPALLQHLFKAYNNNKEKVPEKDVNALKVELDNWKQDDGLDNLWQKIFGIIVRFKIMIGASLELLRKQVVISDDGKKMTIKNKSNEKMTIQAKEEIIKQERTSMAKEWSHVISQARQDNQYDGITLFAFIEQRIAGIRNERLHPTPKSLDQALTDEERSRLEADYRTLIVSQLSTLHHDPAQVRARMETLYFKAEVRTRLNQKLTLELNDSRARNQDLTRNLEDARAAGRLSTDTIDSLKQALAASMEARFDAETRHQEAVEANRILEGRQAVLYGIINVQGEEIENLRNEIAGTPPPEFGRAVFKGLWAPGELEKLNDMMRPGAVVHSMAMQFIKATGSTRTVGAVKQKIYQIRRTAAADLPIG